MNPTHQPMPGLVMQHPDIPADPSACYPAAPLQTYSPPQPQLQPPPLWQPHPQSGEAGPQCVQVSYTLPLNPQYGVPAATVGHPQPQTLPQPQPPPAKQCRCKCTCDASAPAVTSQPPAQLPPTSPCAATPPKQAKPKSSKASKRSSSSSALPDSPSKTPIAKVEGPAQAPDPLVEELHRFSCRICGKTFKLKGAVVVHMRVHSLVRKYSCSFCEMKFKDTNSLRQHVRRHTGERPYKCSYCDKAFKQQSGLMQHERLHTGERPYVCRYCQRTFVQKNHVDRHERTHTGDKPYSCRQCGATFADRSGLNLHAVAQHGEEPVRLTPAGVEPRGSGRPRKHSPQQPGSPRSEPEQDCPDGELTEEPPPGAEHVQPGLMVKTEAGQEGEEALIVPAPKKARARKGSSVKTPTGKSRRRREEESPQKALWRAGLAPHPGGRPPKHRADVLVLPAPVSIVRTGRKRVPQALVEDLELLPPQESVRSRGRPRKQQQMDMLPAGGGAVQDSPQEVGERLLEPGAGQAVGRLERGAGQAVGRLEPGTWEAAERLPEPGDRQAGEELLEPGARQAIGRLEPGAWEAAERPPEPGDRQPGEELLEPGARHAAEGPFGVFREKASMIREGGSGATVGGL